MNSVSRFIVGIAIACSGCSHQEGYQNVKQDKSWIGKYKHHTEVRGADDGTDDYKLEIAKRGDHYDVSYSHVSMVSYEYKGTGKANKAGGLDVFFTGFESNKGWTKNFKAGNHMFSLKQFEVDTRSAVKLDWEIVPGDDLRKSAVTMFRVEE